LDKQAPFFWLAELTMSEPDLLKLAGVQDEVKEQIMTNEEAKAKLELFEKMFSEGDYTQARKLADELYFEEIDSARGYAMVCGRAYSHYQKILREKGEEECIRINNIFMEYHFGNWLLDLDRVKRQKISSINKFKNEKRQD
jgi:hypothetical protein